MNGLLLVAVLTIPMGQGLQVSAEVDRERTTVGDRITYTVRAILDGDGPVRTMLPAFNGFAIVGRSERREGSPPGQVVLVIELRLRAEQIGQWLVGPIRVEQRLATVLSPEILVEVVEPGNPRKVSALSPRVIRALNRAPLPARGDVVVELLASSDSVVVGEQVDLITAAWFPRKLLDQLRRPPELTPPTVEGVYNAVQPSTAGVGASRLVSGEWYDLYVAHQVIFPLTPGELEIPGAGLAFSVPAGRQYFSDEKAYRMSSDPLRLIVSTPPPQEGKLGGPTARGLAFGYQLSPEPARAGEPIQVDLVLEGVGNVALWPAPRVEWPEGARGYADRSVDTIEVTRGVLGGKKRFRYSVLADSAGSLALPTVRYPYYDPSHGQWLDAVASAVVLPVQPAVALADSRAPLPILISSPGMVSGIHDLSPWVIWALLIAPPLLLLAMAMARRIVRQSGSRIRPLPPRDRIDRLIRRLVPEADRWRPDLVAAALREAGIDERTSDDIAALYVGTSTGRFHPESKPPQDEREKTDRLVNRLPRRLLLTVGLMGATMGGPAAGWSQETTGDSLYRERQYGDATQAYLREAEAQPGAPRLWYNAGAAAYAAGNDAQAAAAWVVANRLSPRSAEIRGAWRSMALRAPDLEREGRAAPLTPLELGLLATVVWIVGWLSLVRRRRLWAAASFVVALMLGAAGLWLDSWYERPLGVVSRLATVRDAPHGLAGEVGRVDELMVVRIIASRPGWNLVRLRTGVRGWAPANAMVETGRLDSGS